MENQPACLYCGKQDDEIPLVNLTFMGKPVWICSTHLPVLIHEPEKLTAQLTDIAKKAGLS